MLLFLLIVSIIWLVWLTILGNLGALMLAAKGGSIRRSTGMVVMDILVTTYIIWYFIR